MIVVLLVCTCFDHFVFAYLLFIHGIFITCLHCFAAAGLCADELERRAAYFHLVAWSLPLVLTITIMALAEVEADSLVGICFLSQALHIRIVFLLLPLVIIVAIGIFFLVQGKLAFLQS